MEQKLVHKMEVDQVGAVQEVKIPKGKPDVLAECTRIAIKGPSRGYLLWRTLNGIRKKISKVSEPMSKGKRRSLRRQLSFQVDDLERIILGIRLREEEESSPEEQSEDEEMRTEVQALVRDAIEEATSSGKIVKADYFNSRMQQVEKECAQLKRKLKEISQRQTSELKNTKKIDVPLKATASPFIFNPKSPTDTSSKCSFASEDLGYAESLIIDHDETSKDKKSDTACNVCGKADVLVGGWRCTSCRTFWRRLQSSHAKGKVLPRCDHWEPTNCCKGCRRRKYENAMAVYCPNVPLGIPPCPPAVPPAEGNFFKEEFREIKIEYW